MSKELRAIGMNMKRLVESIPTPSVGEIAVHPKTADALMEDYAWSDTLQTLRIAKAQSLAFGIPIIVARQEPKPNMVMELSLEMYKDRLLGSSECWLYDFESGSIKRFEEVVESYKGNITPTAKSFSNKRVDQLMTGLIEVAKKHQELGIKPKLLKASPLLPTDYTGLERGVLYKYVDGRVVPYD